MEVTAEQILAAPDALEIVQAVEQVPGGFTRATIITMRSASLGAQCAQTIGYVWPVTDRRWGAESGRSAWIVEAL